MKKFFALMLVVAMLAVSSSAMAVTLTTSTGKTEFTVAQGRSQSVTLSATKQYSNGTLSAITVTGLPAGGWLTYANGTLTISPTTSTTRTGYTIVARVVETVADDGAGHTYPVAHTYSATLPIAVSVVANNTSIIQTIVRVITTVVEEVKTVVVPAVSVRSSMSVKTTVEEAKKSVADTIKETVTNISGGLTDAQKTQISKWTQSADAVQQVQVARKAAVTQAANAATTTFKFTSTTTNVDLTPKEADNYEEAAPLTSSNNPTDIAAAAASNANLAATEVPVATVPPIVVKESGTQSFPQTLGNAFWGKRVGGSRGRVGGNTASAGFSAAAANTEGVAFLNSSGDVVDTIPDDKRSNEIMPGYVNMLVVVEAGETYAPVMFTNDTVSTDANYTVSVDVYETKTVTEYAQVSETGEVVTVRGATEEVTSAIQSVVAGAVEVSTDYYGALLSTTELTRDSEGAKSAKREVVASVGRALGTADKPLPNGKHFVGIDFGGAPEGTVKSYAFEFHPDGGADSTVAQVWVFDENGKQATEFGPSLHNKSGYIAFEIADGAIKTADTNAVLTNPTLTVALEGSNTGTPGTSSSSGGCSAGSAALALAVLGSFIVTRKK